MKIAHKIQGSSKSSLSPIGNPYETETGDRASKMVTLQAREMGDKAWRELLQAHDATVRRMKSREFIGGLGSVAAALNTRAALTNVIPEIIMIRPW